MLRCADCNAVKIFRVIGKSVGARVHKFWVEPRLLEKGELVSKLAGIGHR